MNRRKILSGAQLKYIAFTSMLIDHVNKALIYPNLNGGILLVISDIFDVLGRIAFPIFMFLLIEGYFRTTNRLYRSVIDDSRVIINLASKEYSKCIEKYLTPKDTYITVSFCELSGNKLVTKGTYAKMARGEMVRFMAEREIENPEEIRKFDSLGYTFRRDLSSESEYVFERK